MTNMFLQAQQSVAADGPLCGPPLNLERWADWENDDSMDAKRIPSEVLAELCDRLFEPACVDWRQNIAGVPEPLRAILLVIEFDVEVSMQGVLGFLENSAGRLLSETIVAFEAIGAHEDATVLQRIERIMTAHGVTTARLQTDLATREEHEITSWLEVHGERLEPMAVAIQQAAASLYLYTDASGRVNELLNAYVGDRADDIEAILTTLPPRKTASTI